MKVLVFFDHDHGLYGILPNKPTKIVTGGYKRFVEIAKRMGKHDIDLVVVESSPTYATFDKSLQYCFHEFTIPALRVAGHRISDPWLVAGRMANIGKKLAEKEHFDLILSPCESLEMCLAAFLTSHSKRIPWLAVAQLFDWTYSSATRDPSSSSFRKHLIDSYCIIHNSLDRRILQYLYNNALIISVSSAIENSLRSIGVKSQILICGNGIDFDQIDKIQNRNFSYDGIFVGRFVQSKGPQEALRIFETICCKDANAKFAFVGAGDPKITRMIEEEIAERKMDKNIDLFGYVDEEKKFELMKGSKILISPSHNEGWGIVVAEALACGLPVVCYDLPPFKEIFTCEAVRMCKEGRVDQMIAETLRLLENPTERKRLGILGRNFAKRFSWEEVTETEAKIYRLYVKLLNECEITKSQHDRID